MFSVRCLIMFYIYTKFHINISKGFIFIERTRFVTDRRTDRPTDSHGKKYMSPPDWGGVGVGET